MVRAAGSNNEKLRITDAVTVNGDGNFAPQFIIMVLKVLQKLLTRLPCV
jgi:hypothetical protein